jgi:serine/threonine protein kinase/DNA-binding response OmpR family regulator
MAERSSRTPHADSVDDFVQILLDAGLVPREEIEEARRALAGAGLPTTDDTLARRLSESGRLTDYQIKLVRAGQRAELVIGNYEILDRIGAGGMGAVFKARHRRMKRIVALKVLSLQLVKDDAFVRRFQREVETLARLSHPNIVMAYDADEGESGPFLVMEYVEGRDLSSVVAAEGPLSVAAAVECVLQSAYGLEYAHRQGIIHRDIKPANLLRDSQGVVKVTDLGVARLNSPEGPGHASGLTQTGGVLGSVQYMPPEQAVDSTKIDNRADIYSLGATLYFLLAGKPPYDGPTMMAILLKHRDAPIPSLASARPDVPPALDAIFRRMVAKSPADRYATMADVVQEVEAVKASLGDSADVFLQGADQPVASTAAFESSPLDRPLEATLGTAPQSQERTINVKRADMGESAAGKVLLVEPSRTQSAIIRKYLQAQGVQDVIAVATGQEALLAVRKESPDAIVSAMHLADMTGVQLGQQVRAEFGEAPPGLVLISSEAEGPDAGSLSKCGKAVLVHKPFTPEQLLHGLRMVARSARKAAAPRPELRVLIVDDSAAARVHIRDVLKGLGLSQFTMAADGAQAVATLAKETFDLIVTDYNMPLMDGRGLVGYLRQSAATASTPIIMVTTEKDPAKLEAVRQLGVTVCDKSFPPEAIRGIIDKIARPS